jgi:hypothetical protein
MRDVVTTAAATTTTEKPLNLPPLSTKIRKKKKKKKNQSAQEEQYSRLRKPLNYDDACTPMSPRKSLRSSRNAAFERPRPRASHESHARVPVRPDSKTSSTERKFRRGTDLQIPTTMTMTLTKFQYLFHYFIFFFNFVM